MRARYSFHEGTEPDVRGQARPYIIGVDRNKGRTRKEGREVMIYLLIATIVLVYIAVWLDRGNK